jgi:hypothetical protein
MSFRSSESADTPSTGAKNRQDGIAGESGCIRSAHIDSSLFSFGIALILSIVYLTLKIGFEHNDTIVVLKALALTCTLLFFPIVIRDKLLNREAANSLRREIFSNEAMLLSLALLLATGLGFLLNGNFAPACLGLLSALIVIFGLIPNLIPGLRRLCSSTVIFCFLIISIWTSSFLFGCPWHGTPLFMESLSTHADFLWPIDTLFHTSIANMIRTYGVPSVGLNGIPFMNYHFGSHWIMAQWSSLLDVATIKCYLIVFPIVVLPLIVKSVLTLSVEIMSIFQANLQWFDSPAFWLTLGAGFTAIPDYVATHIWKVDYPFNSESYAFSVALMLLLFSSIVGSRKLILEKQTTKTRVFLIIFICFYTSIILLCKVSTGAVLVPVLAYFFIRLGFYKQPACVALGIVSAALIFGVFLLACPHAGVLTFNPFGYLRDFVTPRWRPLYFLLNYVWLWLLIGTEIQRNNWFTFGELKSAFNQKRTWVMEVAILCAVVGAIPGLVMDLSGDTIYFAILHQPLCLALLLGSGGLRLNFQGSAWKKLYPVGTCALVLLMVLNTFFLAKKCVNLNSQIHSAIEASSPIASKSIDEGDLQGKKNYCMQQLQKLERLPLAEKRIALLYVPQSNTAYWTMLECAQCPFLGPALTGIAMIDGMPKADCDCLNTIYVDFGYLDYKKRDAKNKQPSQPELENLAQKLGFKKVLTLESL